MVGSISDNNETCYREEVERLDGFKFLWVHISADLTWSANMDSLLPEEAASGQSHPTAADQLLPDSWPTAVQQRTERTRNRWWKQQSRWLEQHHGPQEIFTLTDSCSEPVVSSRTLHTLDTPHRPSPALGKTLQDTQYKDSKTEQKLLSTCCYMSLLSPHHPHTHTHNTAKTKKT